MIRKVLIKLEKQLLRNCYKQPEGNEISEAGSS
ncbi:uncharacterized protein METZ01_LOCUS217736 [marine metagenome]|uniref:Uncharacterized protein n=1 Tax=marine metagenome TaxID=408172 RepID=A0A382FQI6_9ZZZZ